ncbi:unnamed protein product [Hermetia illucens]|uniref:Single domain-containing protein n=1 Tax=Hermetia illucens TaxID=343691 RepID=A0A7R8UTK9_HERIL|nr:U-scoloptoxin(16)-Sm2a [Hermetia illucens]CAD7086772.1 unnamed protein product [Hermetia illucens]
MSYPKSNPHGGIVTLTIVVLFIVSWSSAKSVDPRNYIDGRCVDPETKRELFIGEYFHRPGQCVRVQCLGDLSIWEDKCNDPRIQGNCIKEFLNMDQAYPNCCPLYKCEYHIGSTKEIRVFDHHGNIVSRSVTNIILVENNGAGSVMTQAIKVTI